MPGNKTAQQVATVTDLTTDLVGMNFERLAAAEAVGCWGKFGAGRVWSTGESVFSPAVQKWMDKLGMTQLGSNTASDLIGGVGSGGLSNLGSGQGPGCQ